MPTSTILVVDAGCRLKGLLLQLLARSPHYQPPLAVALSQKNCCTQGHVPFPGPPVPGPPKVIRPSPPVRGNSEDSFQLLSYQSGWFGPFIETITACLHPLPNPASVPSLSQVFITKALLINILHTSLHLRVCFTGNKPATPANNTP